MCTSVCLLVYDCLHSVIIERMCVCVSKRACPRMCKCDLIKDLHLRVCTIVIRRVGVFSKSVLDCFCVLKHEHLNSYVLRRSCSGVHVHLHVGVSALMMHPEVSNIMQGVHVQSDTTQCIRLGPSVPHSLSYCLGLISV